MKLAIDLLVIALFCWKLGFPSRLNIGNPESKLRAAPELTAELTPSFLPDFLDAMIRLGSERALDWHFPLAIDIL